MSTFKYSYQVFLVKRKTIIVQFIVKNICTGQGDWELLWRKVFVYYDGFGPFDFHLIVRIPPIHPEINLTIQETWSNKIVEPILPAFVGTF